MASRTTAPKLQTLVVRSRKDKALRRKARNQARRADMQMERVSNRSTSALIKVGSVAVATQIEKMYKAATRDMDQRLTLKGKDRRKLNIAEFDVTDPKAGDFWKEDAKTTKRGKRDHLATKPTDGYYAALAILQARASN